MITSIVSFMSGVPGLILKIAFLGVINASTVWAIPILMNQDLWEMLAILVLATLALDIVLLAKRGIAAKYLVPASILLVVFQLIPTVYTVSIAFTNYGTGHIVEKREARELIKSQNLSQPEDRLDLRQFDLLVARDASGSIVPILGDSLSSDFPYPVYLGVNNTLLVVEESRVLRDENGYVSGVQGLTRVDDSELASLTEELEKIQIPTGNDKVIVVETTEIALEMVPVLSYDTATDTFTSLETGAVYRDTGQGAYISDTLDENGRPLTLSPGWREGVGLGNFARILQSDEIRGPFVQIFIWTFAYAALSVLLTFALGLALALALNKDDLRGRKVYRSILIVPYAIPSFLSILIWRGLLNDDFGAINETLNLSIPWLFDPFWGKVAILLVNLWLGFPYMFLVATGALQAIPAELSEAAQVDGARASQVLRLVKLPLLLVAIAPLLIASFAYNFNNFNNIYLLTGGGPVLGDSPTAGSTDILISYTYKIAFASGQGQDFGLASAISIIIFFIVATISTITYSQSRAFKEMK